MDTFWQSFQIRNRKHFFCILKIAAAGKGRSDDGLTPQQRNERDAKALAEKQARKAAQKEAQANGGGKK